MQVISLQVTYLTAISFIFVIISVSVNPILTKEGSIGPLDLRALIMKKCCKTYWLFLICTKVTTLDIFNKVKSCMTRQDGIF